MAPLQEVRDVADVEAFFEASHREPVVLFKHSIACGLSAHGRQKLRHLDGELPLYLLVVQRAREASGYAAERLGLRHETPQVILVKDGEAVYHASHLAISADALRAAAQEARSDTA